ncbi:MAG TPA: adenosylcobinamide-GDP ribazoletransferase [Roseiarcus sp.]|nr:adenosylcobinamide-GDP ribazoletransferase [Roseiarcus sp.]
MSEADTLLRRFAHGVVVALRFYSRLPLPSIGVDRPPFAAPSPELLARYAAPAGAIIGACGALVLALSRGLGLPLLPSAALAIGALVLICGALHEDGLADIADGFGGGATRERKLEILRDSRIGAYGAAALALSLILRVAALSSLAAEGTAIGAAALIVAGAVSRSFGLIPLAILDPARSDGAGASVGRLDMGAFLLGALAAFLIAVVLGLAVLGFGRAVLASIVAAAASFGVAAVARRQIGGQTGDVAGAAQQLAEIACLCGLLIGESAA